MLALATFMLLFGPRLQLVDLHTLAVLAFAGLGVLSLLSRGERRWISFLLIAQIPGLAYAAFVSLSAGAGDLTMLWIAFKWMLYLLAGFGLADLYQQRAGNEWENLILRHTMLAALVNALFVVAVVISAPLRTIASSLLVMEEKGHWIEEGFRGFDLSMGGGASGSIVFAVLFVAFVHASVQRPVLPLSALCAAVMFMGTGLSGRTGLAIAAAGLFLIAVASPSGGSRSWRGVSTLAGMGVLTVAAGLFVALSESPVAIHFREVVMPWALEGLLSDSGGATGNRSVNAIVEEMLFLPPTDSELLMGSGNAGRSEILRYIPSDVGYVRMLFSVGVIGTVLFACGYFPLAMLSWRSRKTSPLSFGVGFYLVVTVMVNLKELHLAPRGGAALLALWSAALALAHERKAASLEPNESVAPRVPAVSTLG